MRGVISLTDSSRPTSRIFNSFLILALLLSFTTFELARPVSTAADPALSVSTSVTTPLLGGSSTVSITVTNTGPDKGYNLSLETTISSSIAPSGTVTIGDAAVPPTAQAFDPLTGATTLTFIDLVDLAPTESYTLTFEIDLSADPTWEVGDLVLVSSAGQVNTIPNNSGTWIAGADTAQAEVIPIDLITKTANQSTGVQQASGTETRAYSYTIEVQNNYTNPSYSVVVTDTVPDGVEFLGMAAGSDVATVDAGFGVPDPVTGETALQWTLGTMAPGELITLVYDTGVRYDYYGTAHGGNNRPTDVFDGRETTSTVVDHKTVFSNTAGSISEYKGSLPATITPTDSDSADVEGVYVTIDKSGTPSTGGYGTTVTYTLTYATSQYYTADNIVVSDTLPDGMTYVPASASTSPTVFGHNADGTTDISWDMPPLGQTEQGTITFQATVDTKWEGAPYTDQPIRAGDYMTNHAELAADWHDQVNARDGSDVLVAEVSAGLSTGLPSIEKSVWDPDLNGGLGDWTDKIDAQVGDVIEYRARLNCDDTQHPIRKDISLGYITLTDWLPPGVVYNNDAVPSYVATFTQPASAPASTTPDPDNPTNVTLGSLSGIEWFLGDVSADGWWETTFTVTVQDVPAVVEGLKTGNHWKLTGINTFGQEYSDRDIATLDYLDPFLTLDKSTGVVPSPLIPGSVVPYTITIDNDQVGVAEDVLVTDTLPVGMRDTTPTITAIELNSSPLVADVDYTTTYDPVGGVWTIDLHDGAVDTPIPGGASLVIEYDAVVAPDVAAGATLNDIATVGYNTQADGSGRYVPGTSSIGDPNTDDAEVQLAPLALSKTRTPAAITLGEIVHYDIQVTVPRGMVAYWPRIYDRVNRDGLWYVPGTATISDTTGTPVVPATFETTSTPTRILAGSPSSAPETLFAWNLANPIDNRGQATDYTFVLGYDMRYTGVTDTNTQELFLPSTTSDVLRNDYVRAYWELADGGTRPATNGDYDIVVENGTDADVDVNQPLITTTKAITSAAPYTGSSTVSYRVYLDNLSTNTRSQSTAYDIDWQDILPSYMGNPTLTGVTRRVSGVTSSVITSVTPSFGSTPTVSIDFDAIALAKGDRITITYTADIDPNVPAGITLTNTTDVDWSSLPGTPAGSRRYDDRSWESGWTNDTRSQSLAVTSPTIAKTIVGPNPTRIGDTIAYNVRVTVPKETVLPSSRLADAIALDGLTYVPGSAATSLVSGSPETSATIASVSENDNAPNPGSAVTFNLVADIDNASSAATTGDTPYVFDLTYEMVYEGVTDGGGWDFFLPGAGDTVVDTARLYWTPATSETNVSSAATLDVDQPLLDLTKTETSTGPYAGGDTVAYECEIENVGYATAYELSWEDILAPDLSDATLVSVTHSSAGSIIASVTPDFSDWDVVTIDFDDVTLAVGETITIVYTAVVDPWTGAGSTQTNTADVDWTSHPTSPDKRVYDDSANESAWTDDTDSATVDIEAAVIDKTIEDGDVTRTIGEEFEYYVSFSIPTSTTAYNMTITDTLPDGLELLYANRSSVIGTVTTSAVGDDTQIEWDLGDVTNPPHSTLVLTLGVRVQDDYDAGGALNGLLPTQDTLDNVAAIDWETANTGGTPQHSEDSVEITIEEPHLTIDKVVSDADLGPSETTTYTVTIANNGTSTAYDTQWSDTIPAALFDSGSSPVLQSVLLDGTPLGMSDFSADFSAAVATIDFNVPLPVGSAITIVYSATLEGGIARGTTLTNLASIDEYRSLPSTATGERVSGPVTDSEDITVQAPEITVVKDNTGDDAIQFGESAEWRVRISNTGDAPAYSVTATDTLPAGFVYVPGSVMGTQPGVGAFSADPTVIATSTLVWDFGAYVLQPGTTIDFTFESTATANAPLGLATNSAAAVAEDALGYPVAEDDYDATVMVTDPRVSITKTRIGDPFVQVTDTAVFRIVITNTGSTRLDTVPLVDTYDSSYLDYALMVLWTGGPITPVPNVDVPGTVSWNNVALTGPLNPGNSLTLDVYFDVVGHPASSSTTNTATIPGAIDQYLDTTPSVVDSATIGITAPAATITKSLATTQSATVRIGDTIDYTIAIENSGDTTLAAIAVGDAFVDADLDYVTATPAPSSTTAGSLTWTDITTFFGDLAPGATATMTVTMRATGAAASSTNIAGFTATDINSDPTPPLTGLDTASVTIVEPALTIDKSADTLTLGPGETARYTVHLANTGNGAAYDVLMTDLVPGPLWAPSVVGVVLDGTTTLTAGVGYTVDMSSPTSLDVQLTAGLAPGATLDIIYDATLAGGTPAGTSLENTASVTYSSLPGSDPNEATYGPHTDTWTITSRAPELFMTKSVTGDTELQRGEVAQYRIVADNIGDAPAFSVVVTDTLPPGMTYVPGSSSATWSGGGSSAMNPVVMGSTLVWSWPTSVIAPTENLTLDFRASVDMASALEIKVNNADTGAEDGGGSPIAPVTDDAALRVTEPGASLSKQLEFGQDTHIQVGEFVTFDIVVSNSGDTTITLLPLTDIFDPTYLRFDSATPSPDTTAVASLDWDDLTDTFGDFAPGDIATVTATFEAIAHPATSSTTDTATVVGATDEFGDEVPVTPSTRAISITQPSVMVRKFVDAAEPSVLRLGETTTFDLVVTNTGDTVLTHIPLDDTYDPTLLEFVSASPSVNSTSLGGLGWSDITSTFGNLMPAQSATVTVTFRALAVTASTTNAAAVSGVLDINTDGMPDDSDATTVSVVAPTLETSKTAGVPDLGPGETTNYTVDITNTGNGPAYDLLWEDAIPAWLFASGTSPALFAVSLDGAPLTDGVHYTADFSSSATVTIDFDVPVPAGSMLRIVYLVTLEGGHPAGVTLTNNATVTEYSSLPGADPFETVFGPVSASDDIVTRAPELAIAKTVVGDRQVQIGQTVYFSVTTTNTGNAPAEDIQVTDTLPAGLGYTPGSAVVEYSTGTTAAVDPSVVGSVLTWDFGPASVLDPAEWLRIDFETEVLGTTTFGTAINTVQGDALDGGGVPVASVIASDSVLITDPSVTVDKHLAPGQDAHIQVGELVTFDIVVTNDGTTRLETIPLSDTYDPTYLEFVGATPSNDTTAVGAVGWNDITDTGTLAVDATMTISVTFLAIAHPPTSSTFDMARTSGVIDEYTDSADDAEDTAYIAITNPQVSVDKTLSAGQDRVLALGESVSFDITVTNSGDTTLTTVPLVDTFDATRLSFASATPAPSTKAAGTLSWNDLTIPFGDFAPGHSEVVSVRFNVTGTGASATNTGTVPPTALDVWGDSPAGAVATATVDTYDPAEVFFEKTADPPAGTIVLPGDIITYSLTFRNDTAVDFPLAVVTDELPDSVSYVSGSMTLTRNGGSSTKLTDAADADAGLYAAGSPETVTFSLGTLAAGEDGVASFDVEVGPEDISRRGVRNYARIVTDGDDLAETGPVDHPVDPFDIIKTGEDVNGGRLEAGDDILWTITVTNTGITPTTHVVVEDTVPTGTTYVAGSMTGPGANESASPNLVWNIGTMDVDEVVVVTFISRVNSGLPAGTEIRNQALVRSDQSFAKYSDSPETPELGDATLLQTGHNDWIWLGLAMLAVLAGAGTTIYGRRKARAA